MFNKNSSASEIEQSMERGIVSAELNKQTEGLNKIAVAIDHLNAAAELFDDAGMYRAAEYTTSLLEVVAKKKKPKKKPSKKSEKKSDKKSKKDPATDGLTSDKEVENLKNKGWVFNADDNSADDVSHDDDCMCSDCSFVDDINDVKPGKKHGHDCVCPHCTGIKHSHDDDCMCSMCMDANDVSDTNFHFDTDEDASWQVDRNYADSEHKHRPEHERIMHDLENMHDFEDEESLGGLERFDADKAKKEDFWNTDMFKVPGEFGHSSHPAMKPRRRF